MKRGVTIGLLAALVACRQDTQPAVGVDPATAPRPQSQAPSAPVVPPPAIALAASETVESWIDELYGDDADRRSAAMKGLRAAGDAATPALVARYFGGERARSESADDPVSRHIWPDGDALRRLLTERPGTVVPVLLARYDAGGHETANAIEMLTTIAVSGGFGEHARLVVETMLRHTGDPAAVRLLGACGAAAEGAVPELAGLLTTPKVSESAFGALASLGPRASPALGTLMKLLNAAPVASSSKDEESDSPFPMELVDPDSNRRHEGRRDLLVIRTIGCIGPGARDAVPRLVTIADSGDPAAREAALSSLAEIGVVDETVSAAVLGRFRPDPGPVGAVVDTIRRLGLRGPDVVSALAEAVRQSERSVPSVLVSLAADDPAMARCVAELLGTPPNDWGRGEQELWGALRDRGGRSRAAVVVILVAQAGETDRAIRIRALRGLTTIDDPAARTAALVSLAAARADDRCEVVRALQPGGPPDARTLSALDAAVADSDAETARAALHVLQKLGRAAAAVGPRVQSRADDASLGDDALDTLAYLGVADERIPPSVAARLASDDEQIRAAALVVLAELGDAALTEVPRLTAWIADPDESWWVRRHAVETLAKLGATDALFGALRGAGPTANEAREVLPRLPVSVFDSVARLSRDPDSAVRAAAMTWLGGTRDRRSESLLVAGLADEVVNVREEAAEALGQLSGLSPTSVDALRRAVRDAEEHVRLAAASSLAAYDRETAAASLMELAAAMPESHAPVSTLARIGADRHGAGSHLASFLRPPLCEGCAAFAMTGLTGDAADARAAAPELAAIVSRRVREGMDATVPRLSSSQVRAEAARILGIAGGADAIAGLREALFDPCRDVRDASAAALAKLSAK